MGMEVVPVYPYIPALQRPDTTYAESTKENMELLFKRFFPAPLPANTSGITAAAAFYPPTVNWPRITEEEVERAAKGPGQDKVPGPCKIPNRALKEGLTVLLLQLVRLFNACLFHG